MEITERHGESKFIMPWEDALEKLDKFHRIDIAQVGPWRLRCKQCGDVLYDPSRRGPAAAPES